MTVIYNLVPPFAAKQQLPQIHVPITTDSMCCYVIATKYLSFVQKLQ